MYPYLHRNTLAMEYVPTNLLCHEFSFSKLDLLNSFFIQQLKMPKDNKIKSFTPDELELSASDLLANCLLKTDKVHSPPKWDNFVSFMGKIISEQRQRQSEQHQIQL